ELNRLTADELVEIAGQAGFSVARQERRHYEPVAIPEVLLQRYPRDLLTNNEIFLLLQRAV
ncbi:MAG: SAM-dependent methyltransferase, partial [Comamonas sp.]